MDIEEARERIRKKGLLFELMGIKNLNERARKLFAYLPETSSWDLKAVMELSGLLQEDIELQRQVLEDTL